MEEDGGATWNNGVHLRLSHEQNISICFLTSEDEVGCCGDSHSPFIVFGIKISEDYTSATQLFYLEREAVEMLAVAAERFILVNVERYLCYSELIYINYVAHLYLRFSGLLKLIYTRLQLATI